MLASFLGTYEILRNEVGKMVLPVTLGNRFSGSHISLPSWAKVLALPWPFEIILSQLLFFF
jgi:hypothetical protein